MNIKAMLKIVEGALLSVHTAKEWTSHDYMVDSIGKELGVAEGRLEALKDLMEGEVGEAQAQ